MKTILSILTCLLLVSCGGSGTNNDTGSTTSCSSPLIGTWNGTTYDDQLNAGADTNFTYTGVGGCTSTGTFVCPGELTSGNMTVTITLSSGGYCLSAGQWICAFEVVNDTLAFQCTNGTVTNTVAYYTKG